MLITKSLFVDYMDFPKLAWRKIHDRDIYNKIRKIETEEEKQHIIQLGQAVEDAVLEYLRLADGRDIVNLIPDFKEEIVVTDDSADDDDRIDEYVQKYTSRKELCERTLAAIRSQHPILYQPSFQCGDCFVRADVMVLQPNGQYRLIEVKAKSGVRKAVTDDGESKKIGSLDTKFIHDLSFQKYVINHVLQDNQLPVLDSIFMAHLNKDYVKQGDLDYRQLIVLDQMDRESEVSVIQRKKETTLVRDDTLMSAGEIQSLVSAMQKEVSLDQDAFNVIHPFLGNKYLEYFAPLNAYGKLEKPQGTIYSIPKLHHSKAPVVQALHEDGRIQLMDLSEEEIAQFYSKDGMGAAGEFIELYRVCADEPHIVSDAIRQEFAALSYPICFYDYESVSTPIPFMDNTYPYQQVVVQYSLHKLYADGTMQHYGGVLAGTDRQEIQTLSFDHDNLVEQESEKVVYGSYKDLLQAMLADIGDDVHTSSFIVWYKPFENTRNAEIAGIFPDLADDFLSINEKTYDLMDIFAKRYYFDRAFQGSCSIKKVLPVLVPEMNYEALTVSNGGIAMKKLHELISGTITDPITKQTLLQDLLIYCGQDSLAMVKIFQTIVKNIG